MIVDQKVVTDIAELAQLQISAADMQEYVSSLASVLKLVEEMQFVDTQGVEPMSNPLDSVQKLRIDEVSEENQREIFLENAPEASDGLYLVPRVVE